MTSESLGGSYKHYAQSRSPKILASRRHTLFIRCIGDGDMAAREEVGVCRYARFLDTREIEIPPSSDMVDSNCIPGLTPFDHHASPHDTEVYSCVSIHITHET